MIGYLKKILEESQGICLVSSLKAFLKDFFHWNRRRMNIFRSGNLYSQIKLMCSDMRHIKPMQTFKFMKIVIIATDIISVDQEFARHPSRKKN